MRGWLRDRNKPIYGTKSQLWERVLIENQKLLREEAVQNELQRQLEERRRGASQMPAVPMKQPNLPTEEERKEHELTHAVYKDWCEFCIMGKGTEDPHKKVDPNQCRMADGGLHSYALYAV